MVDAFRLRHLAGPENANEALRRYRRSRQRLSTLLTTAPELNVGKVSRTRSESWCRDSRRSRHTDRAYTLTCNGSPEVSVGEGAEAVGPNPPQRDISFGISDELCPVAPASGFAVSGYVSAGQSPDCCCVDRWKGAVPVSYRVSVRGRS